MRIGVGITTTSSRSNHEQYWRGLALSLCEGMDVVFVKDVKGVAKAKNECLKQLQHCDHIFLFDDDTFPIQHGWADFFINHSERTGNNHFSYLHPYLHIYKVKTNNGIGIYNNAAGCMMYFTRDAVEKVGAYNEQFGPYGYEHAEYSLRMFKSSLCEYMNICPDGADDYIYSMDLDSHKEFSFVHHSSLSTIDMHTSVQDAYKHFSSDPILYLPL